MAKRFKYVGDYFYRPARLYPPSDKIKSDYVTTNNWLTRFIVIQLAKIVLPHICNFKQSRTVIIPSEEVPGKTCTRDSNIIDLFTPNGPTIIKTKVTRGDLTNPAYKGCALQNKK